MSSANRDILTVSLPICIPFIPSSCLIALARNSIHLFHANRFKLFPGLLVLRADCRATTLGHRGPEKLRCPRLSLAEPMGKGIHKKFSVFNSLKESGRCSVRSCQPKRICRVGLRCGRVPNSRWLHLSVSQDNLIPTDSSCLSYCTRYTRWRQLCTTQ
jgi:hypothetical protein